MLNIVTSLLVLASSECMTIQDRQEYLSNRYPDLTSRVVRGEDAKKFILKINNTVLHGSLRGDVIVIHTRKTHHLALIESFVGDCAVQTGFVKKELVTP